MQGEKTCFRCGQTKHVTLFHAHKYMADGRLNKCASCVKECVDEWRKANPGARSKEHRRVADRKGMVRQSEYLAIKKANAVGRKASSLKYFYKRMAKIKSLPVWDQEFDDLAMEEAKILADSRAAITGVPWEVDHIVPLNHRKASGLHNAYNLNVAPAAWNLRKSNRNMSRFFGTQG